MPKTSEKRKFFRHPIHSPIKLELDSRTDPWVSEAADISLGGLSFLWKRKLSKGNTIRLFIAVKEKIFDVKGRVVYSLEDRKTGKFRNGILFVDPPSAFRARLAEQALEIIEYRRALARETGRDVSEEEAALKWIEQFAAHFPAPA
ncbi:MAG: PilZ domain-containing protein [Candidatus Omnitrophica bacterium]|nr:PilZ domain-containing protein [Candidatus Omnitrophota bacterium]